MFHEAHTCVCVKRKFVKDDLVLFKRDVLQCVAVCCSVLQCVAVCCSVLQCVAACCSVLQCYSREMFALARKPISHTNSRANILHQTAIHSSTLQHTSMHARGMGHACS